MCIVCTDWLKGKMTNEEALKALDELIVFNGPTDKSNDHYFETYEKVLDKEMEKDKKNGNP